MAWMNTYKGQTINVTPVDDLRDHVLSERCWCHPKIEGNIIVHNALDGREQYETGHLRAH